MIEIEKHTLLSFLEPEMAKGLIQKTRIETLNEGDVIFNEEDKADDIYLILSGAVRVLKKDPTGKDQLLAILKENDYFGEYAVIDGQPRSAGAVAAMADTVLGKLPGEELMRIFEESDGNAALRMLLHIIRNVREINEEYAASVGNDKPDA